jgi:hypothetical protein
MKTAVRTEAAAQGTSIDALALYFDISVLNGHSERARQGVQRAAAVVLDTILVRRGEHVAERFVGDRTGRATVLAVPREMADEPTLHHGMEDMTISLDFGGNSLTVGASRRSERTTTISFRPSPMETGGTLWIPTQTTHDGQTELASPTARDLAQRERGQEQLVHAAARLGEIATEAMDAMVSQGTLGPQLDLLLQYRTS